MFGELEGDPGLPRYRGSPSPPDFRQGRQGWLCVYWILDGDPGLPPWAGLCKTGLVEGRR